MKGLLFLGTITVLLTIEQNGMQLQKMGMHYLEMAIAFAKKGKMDFPEKANQFAAEGEPIPDINTDSKPDNITVSNDTVRQTEVQRCVNEWNSLAEYGIKQISRMAAGTQRYERLVARIKQYGIDDVLKAIAKIRASSFLQGRSGSKRQWVITFDWFVCPNNFPKVLDGNYDDVEIQNPIYHTSDSGGGRQ